MANVDIEKVPSKGDITILFECGVCGGFETVQIIAMVKPEFFSAGEIWSNQNCIACNQS